MKQEPLKRRRPAARKRGRKQTLRAVVLSVLTVSVIALCLGIWTRLPRRRCTGGRRCAAGGVRYPLLHLLRHRSRNLNHSLWWRPSAFPQQEIT